MPISPPCSCSAPGYCARTGKDMAEAPHLYQLCRTRDDYRALWEARAHGLPSPRPERRPPCCHLEAARFQPLWTFVLRMPAPPWAQVGQEDPRLFSWRGKLHCAYVGGRVFRDAWEGSQMVCRLSEDFQVEASWRCRYQDNQP